MAAKRIDINLLPPELRVPGRWQVVSRLLRQGSFVALGIYIFTLVLLFVVSLLFARQEGTLLAQNALLASRVEDLKSSEGLVLVLKDRAKLAQVVFAKSPQVSDALLDDIINTFSSGTQVSEIVSESGNAAVTAIAQNSSELKEIFAKLQGINTDQIVLSALTLDTTGGYSFSLEVK